jgi:hypothetical protein
MAEGSLSVKLEAGSIKTVFVAVEIPASVTDLRWRYPGPPLPSPSGGLDWADSLTAFACTGSLAGMRVAFAAILGLVAVAPGCASKQDCMPAPETNPDYASHASWACRPDMQGDACDIDLTAVEILPDGRTQKVPFSPAADPKADCFYVYPTVDLGLRTRLHEDLSDKTNPYKTAGVQAARFGEVCRVYAPLYRQVTLGTYGADKPVRDFCLDAAFKDVLAAFDHYLQKDNHGRPFVLISHSQGSHMLSRLIRQRIDQSTELRARLVVALAIGGNLGTDGGGRTGGSFKNVPVCSTAEEQGCAIGYRSYPPGASISERDASLKEGKRGVCIHPGDIPGGGPKTLSRSFFSTNTPLGELPEGVAEQAPFVLYRDFYEARCITLGDAKALEVRPRGASGDTRENPIDFDAQLFQGDLGLHLYDFQLAMGDLIDLVRTKIEARPAP